MGHHQDAAPGETPITKSITTERGVCNGTPICDGGGCTNDLHCEQLNYESQCEDLDGCRWEVITEIDEGTDTGKRCTGDVGTCGDQSWECKPGCEETFDGNRRVCSGAPEPCSAKVYASECGRIWTCTWE